MDPERLTTWFATLLVDSAPDPLLDWLSRAGAVGVLAFVVAGFVRGWIVPSPEVGRLVSEIEQLRKERDRALDLVYASAENTGQALAALKETHEKWSHLGP